MPWSEQEANARISEFLLDFAENAPFGPGRIFDEIAKYIDNWMDPQTLYVPSDVLVGRIEEYSGWCDEHGDNEDGSGELMEQIAALAFNALAGCDSIRSYRSVESQLDLVATGTTAKWKLIMLALGIKSHVAHTVVIEAKNEQSRVSANQMSRLCSIMQNKFANDSCLYRFAKTNQH
jgi:hypothetical protein